MAEHTTVPAHTGPAGHIYVTCHQCNDCGHIGINDEHATEAACNRGACGWSGPTPSEDQCPGCGDTGTMASACPKCSGHYVLLAEADVVPHGVAIPSPALLVTVCEMRDGDGLMHCAMLHHAGQRAMDGMCVERRADLSEVEAEAAEWREFLSLGVGAPTPSQQPERVPCRGCTSEIYCEMNGCKRPRTYGVGLPGEGQQHA